MAIPRAGTFEYVGVVPDRQGQYSGEWELRDESGAEASTGADRLCHDRLVGLRPSLQITDLGMTPDVRASPFTGHSRPKVLLSRLTLRAATNERASVAAFSFCVDQALTRSWRVGDVLHVARTSGGGLGLSVVRGNRVIAAIGAVTAVPNGELTIRFPSEAIREAARVFSRLDPRFKFRELPIEIRLGAETLVLYSGRPRIGEYEVFVEHGCYPGFPWVSECAAVSLVGSCPDTAAIASAQLLEYSDLSEMVRW
jgi:hypothetical protein